MFNLFRIILPILLTYVINPVLLAAVIFSLGSRKPLLNSFFILSGWFILYLVAGIAIVLGLDAVIYLLANPRPVDFIIEIIIGVLLCWLGLIMFFGKKKKKEPEYDDAASLKPSSAFWIGASINLIGLPFAIPYFAVIDQILKADLNWTTALSILFIYNLLYIIPFAALLLIRILFKEKSGEIFSKINSVMEQIANILIPFILIALGAALIADAVFYFSRGSSLF